MSVTTVTNGAAGKARPFGRFEWTVARRYLGATRKGAGVSLISAIAFVGIMLSVATLITVMSVFAGFRTILLEQLLSVNGHVYVSSVSRSFTDYETRTEDMRTLPFVTRATPILRLDSYLVKDDGGQGAVIMFGIRPEDLRAIGEINDPRELIGSLDSFGEGRFGGRDIVIGLGMANQLGVRVGDTVTAITAGGAETPFGRQPTTQKDYRVGAIFSVGNSQFDTYYAYMPLEQAQLFGRKEGQVSEIEIRITEPIDIDPYLEPVQVAAGPGAYVTDWRQRNAAIFGAVQTEQSLMRILMLMIVLVATMLIISGLVMLVKDKRSDIAVMRTMGATQGNVMRMFMLVGASIGVTGALAGVLLGAAIIFNLSTIEQGLSALTGRKLFDPSIYFLDEIPAIFQWGEVGVVVVFTLVMAFIFSAYPAWQASRVDPVEALRYE